MWEKLLNPVNKMFTKQQDFVNRKKISNTLNSYQQKGVVVEYKKLFIYKVFLSIPTINTPNTSNKFYI
jgi:hypothetical protein